MARDRAAKGNRGFGAGQDLTGEVKKFLVVVAELPGSLV